MNQQQSGSVAQMRCLVAALDGVVSAAKSADRLGLAYAAIMLQEAIEIYAAQCEAYYAHASNRPRN